ncbi:hypothetical protein PSP6_740025 [Paraburkholderia tropica]|nr:hypothetical protein PSP6_740025 [Paraburkholderia tropica]
MPLFVGDRRVGVHLLDVVQVFERVEQLLHLHGVVAGELDFGLRLHRDFGHFGLEARGFQRVLDLLEVVRRADHFDTAVVVRHDVVGARFERGVHQLVFGRARREHELADVIEHERHRAVRAHVAAELRECVAHFRDRAGAVVGHGVDDDRRAADAVAFVADFFVVRAVDATHAALDRAVDVVLGHVRVIGLVDGQTQTRVRVDFAPAHARRHLDFLDEPRPDLAALGISRGFLVFDVGPFRMTRHTFLRRTLRACMVLVQLSLLRVDAAVLNAQYDCRARARAVERRGRCALECLVRPGWLAPRRRSFPIVRFNAFEASGVHGSRVRDRLPVRALGRIGRASVPSQVAPRAGPAVLRTVATVRWI